MRLIFLSLAALLLLIQYPLWLGKGGWLRVWDLDQQVDVARKKNEELSGAQCEAQLGGAGFEGRHRRSRGARSLRTRHDQGKRDFHSNSRSRQQARSGASSGFGTTGYQRHALMFGLAWRRHGRRGRLIEKQLRAIDLVEFVMLAAEIAIDSQLAQVRSTPLRFLRWPSIFSMLPTFSRVQLQWKLGCLGSNIADRLFPEQAAHQCADVGLEQFVLLQGRRQHHRAIPGFQIVSGRRTVAALVPAAFAAASRAIRRHRLPAIVWCPAAPSASCNFRSRSQPNRRPAARCPDMAAGPAACPSDRA